jgi:cobalamin biosynthesis Mg chelatase CobN
MIIMPTSLYYIINKKFYVNLTLTYFLHEAFIFHRYVSKKNMAPRKKADKENKGEPDKNGSSSSKQPAAASKISASSSRKASTASGSAASKQPAAVGKGKKAAAAAKAGQSSGEGTDRPKRARNRVITVLLTLRALRLQELCCESFSAARQKKLFDLGP